MQNSYTINADYIKNVLKRKGEKDKNNKVWTVEEIADLLQRNDKFVINSLIVLYSYQTREEQFDQTTVEANGVGFNAFDAGPLTDIYDWMVKNGIITIKQVNFVRKKIMKYKRQLTEIANHEIY